MRILLGLFLFGLLLYLPGSGSRRFWGNDENRYAVVARHMAEDGGSLALLENHGKPYSDKPPFLFWCVTLSSRVAGSLDEASARLPVAVFGAATLALTFVFGLAAFGARVGLVAALLLGSAGEFFWLSRRLAFDPILAFWVTLAAFGFFLGFERGRRRAYYAAFAAMAFATLSKGPIGIVFPLAGLLAFALVSGPRARLREVPWLTGFLLLAAILSIWLVPAAIEGGRDFLNDLVFRQQFDRTTGERGHAKPFYFYLEAFPAGFLPWTPLLLAAPFLARSGAFGTGPERRGAAYCGAFFVAGFVFLSVLTTKRNLYAIPLFPAAALLSAAALDAGWRGAAGRLSPWLASYPAAVLAAAGALGLAAAFALPGLLGVSPGEAALAIPAVAVPAIAGFALHVRRRSGVLVSLGATAAGAGIFFGLVLAPARDPSESNAALARDLASRLGPGDRVAVYRIQPHEMLYYTGLRRVEEPADARALAALRDAPERLFVVVEDKHVDEVKAVFAGRAEEIVAPGGPAPGGLLAAKDKDRLHVFVTR